MGIRDLVTGRSACAAPGSSSSNALSTFADAFLGYNPTSEVTKGLSASAVLLKASFDLLKVVPLSTIPGDDAEIEVDQGSIRSMKGTDFLNGHHGDACGEIFQTSPLSVPDVRGIEPLFRESEKIDLPKIDGPPEINFPHPLHRSPYQPYNVWAHQSKEHLQGLVNRSMDHIDFSYHIEMRRRRIIPCAQMDEFWNQLPTIHYKLQNSSTEVLLHFSGQHGADCWFPESKLGTYQQVLSNDEYYGGLVTFGRQHGADSWFSEFKKAQIPIGQIGGMDITNMVVLEQPHTFEQGIDGQVVSDDEFSGGWLSFLGIVLSHLGGLSKPRFWDDTIKWHDQVIGRRVWIEVEGMQQRSGWSVKVEATRISLFDALQDAAMLAIITMRLHFPCEFRGTPFVVLPMVPGQRSTLDYPAVSAAAVAATFMGINYDDVATLQRERFASFHRERRESVQPLEEYVLMKQQSVGAVERLIEEPSSPETKPSLEEIRKMNANMEANFIMRDCGWSVLVSNEVQQQVEPSHQAETPPATASSPALSVRARL